LRGVRQIAFLGGPTGELSPVRGDDPIVVVISGLVALTLTPSLCVLILKREHHEPGRFSARSTPGSPVSPGYVDGVSWMLRRGLIALLLFAGMVALALACGAPPRALCGADETRATIAAVFLPDGSTPSARTRW
jgi:HAE1 family hydrophobic/amphiphilic exporter-1/multidrug efflux pump